MVYVRGAWTKNIRRYAKIDMYSNLYPDFAVAGFGQGNGCCRVGFDP